jgi:hypothetical protein
MPTEPIAEAGRTCRARLTTSERSLVRIPIEMPVVVVVHVIPVDQFDPTQILRIKNAFEAGREQPQRKTLLRPHWLAVHAVAQKAIVHGPGDRHARRALYFFRSFCHELGRRAFYTGLLEQRRKQHARPFSATGHPVRFLHGLLSPIVPVSAHSMKCNRVTDGKRFKSSMVKVRG